MAQLKISDWLIIEGPRNCSRVGVHSLESGGRNMFITDEIACMVMIVFCLSIPLPAVQPSNIPPHVGRLLKRIIHASFHPHSHVKVSHHSRHSFSPLKRLKGGLAVHAVLSEPLETGACRKENLRRSSLCAPSLFLHAPSRAHHIGTNWYFVISSCHGK